MTCSMGSCAVLLMVVSLQMPVAKRLSPILALLFTDLRHYPPTSICAMLCPACSNGFCSCTQGPLLLLQATLLSDVTGGCQHPTDCTAF